MEEKKPDGNLSNLVLVYILLQVVLIVFGIMISDVISMGVGMLDLSPIKKLSVLLGICLVILIVLYVLRKRLLYHLSFEGISEVIFSKAERARMRVLSDKWKDNKLSEEEIVEFETFLERTGWPKDLVRKYAKKNYTVKEILLLILSISVVVPFAMWFVTKLTSGRSNSEIKPTIKHPNSKEEKEGADEDTTPSTDG